MARNTNTEELNLLKQRADLMGISYPDNISVTTLSEKIESKLKEDTKDNKENFDINEYVKEQTRLIRCRITNLNPEKNGEPGGIYCVSNKYVGDIRKYIPFHMTDDDPPYHIENIIYKLLKSKKFVKRILNPKKKHLLKYTEKESPEFSIRVLPNLTQEELEELKQQQKYSNRIELDDEY